MSVTQINKLYDKVDVDIDDLSFDEMHAILAVPGITMRVVWLMTKNLLASHQYTANDLTHLEQVDEDYDYDDDRMSHREFEAFRKDIKSFQATNQQIQNSDLTEQDIHDLIKQLFIEGEETWLFWSYYLLEDRFRFNRQKQWVGDLNELVDSIIKENDEDPGFQKFANFANVNPKIAAFVYGKLRHNEDWLRQIYSLLNNNSKDVFDSEVSIDQIPPGQKRWHPRTLKELAYMKADPEEISRLNKFLPDLRP